MVTCQSANQLKTPAKVSWAFKMVSQFGSLGYTIMGKTADLTVVQKIIIDTLHKEGKPQTFIAKEAGCSQSAVSKHVNRKLSGRKKCGRKNAHPPERTAALWGLLSKIDSRIWVNFTRNGLRLGSRHQEPPHTDVSRNLATVVVRGVLPGLRRRRTGLLPSGPKSSFQMRSSFVFHLVFQKEPLPSIEYTYSKWTYFPEGQQFTKKKNVLVLWSIVICGFLLNVS